MNKRRQALVKLILTALLIALNIIIERVPAFKSVSSHISLSVITLGFSAVYLGIGYTIAVAAVGDILGALILPFGAYNPLFTLTNALVGLIIGLALHKKANIFNICWGVLANKIICTLLLNSLWIAIFYKGGVYAFPATIILRLEQTIIMTATEIATLLVLYWIKSPVRKTLDKAIKF